MLPARCTAYAATVALVAATLTGCAPKSDATHPIARSIDGAKNCSQCGEIYIAGETTADGLKALKRDGVRTVLDLRTFSEIPKDYRKQVQDLGMIYLHAPLRSDRLSVEQAKVIVDLLEIYDDEPVLICCGSGNRASAAYALYLAKEGTCDTGQALSIARRTGLKNAKLAADVETSCSAIK